MSLFERKMQNGEVANRLWPVYSESRASVFCAPCLLFGCYSENSFSNSHGFNDWKNAKQRIEEHENTRSHKQCVLNLKERANFFGKIDHELTVQLNEEILYWKNVLKRVVAAIKTLVSRGLSLRGDEEKFGSLHNGNFLMLLEFLAEFDPFMGEHIKKFGNQGSGSTSYLSKTIFEEFIEIMAQKVIERITEEVKEAKYYSIIVDSTPDISHVDQFLSSLDTCNPQGWQ